jgi:hypothetical protein
MVMLLLVVQNADISGLIHHEFSFSWAPISLFMLRLMPSKLIILGPFFRECNDQKIPPVATRRSSKRLRTITITTTISAQADESPYGGQASPATVTNQSTRPKNSPCEPSSDCWDS